MIFTDLTIVKGLPYRRSIRVKGGVNVWPTVDDFEVRSQVRVSDDPSSTLKTDLAPYITARIDGLDIVLDLAMTGAESRTVLGGYYDIVVSDKGHTDLNAIRVLGGKFNVKPLITGG